MQNIEIIPESELARIRQLNGELVKTKENAAALLTPITDLNNKLSNSAINYKALTDAINKHEAILADAQKYEKEALNLQNQLAAALKKVEEAKKRGSTTTKKLNLDQAMANEATRQWNVMLRAIARENLAAEGSTKKLQAQLALMQQTLDGLSDEVRNSPIGKQMQEDFDELFIKVSEAEQKMGKFGRNVGNYASGFNALGFQVQQVARELPSLAHSLPQFFLAISNNVPMLADELQRARAANKALIADGQKGVPVIKQLASSILSWQTALVVGITLVVAFGKEIRNFFKEISTGKAAAKSFAESLRDVRDAMDFDSLGTDIANFQKLAKAWRDLGDDAKSREQFLKDYREEIDRTGIAVNTVNDADNLFIKNTDAYLKSLRLRAQGQAGVNLASKEYAKAIKEEQKNADELEKINKRLEFLRKQGADYAETKTLSFIQGDIMTQTEISTGLEELIRREEAAKAAIEETKQAHIDRGNSYIDVTTKMAQESADALKEAGLEELLKPDKTGKITDDTKKILAEIINAQRDAANEINRIWQKDNAEGLKSVYENEKKNFSERLSALDAFVGQQKQLIEEAEKNQIDQEVRTTAEKLNLDPVKDRAKIENMIRYTILSIRAQAQVDIKNLEEDGWKARLKVIESYLTREAELITREASKRANEINTLESQALQELTEKFSGGKMKTEDYEKEKLKITRKYAKDRLEADIAVLNQSMALLDEKITENAGNEDILVELTERRAKLQMEIDKQVADYGIYLNNIQVEDFKKAGDKQIDIENQVAEKRKEIISGLIDFAMTLSNAATENALANLEKEQKAEEKRFDDQRDQIERLYEAGAIAKEDADTRKRERDDAEKARMEELEQKRKEIQTRQAKFEKAAAITQIAINTAAAITKALPNVALAALTAALGAVQLATAIAQPIPAYAEGTGKDGHKGGWAMVGDGGRPEMVISPSGKTYKTPAYPSLVNLEKGSIVLPNYDLAMRQLIIPELQRIPERSEPKVKDRTGEIIASNQAVVKAVNEFKTKYSKGSKTGYSNTKINQLKQARRV